MTDCELLERYVSARDERAFEELVRRHGAMVLGICRRSLRDSGSADDAFQSTFLILVANARTIRKRDSLASWLYGVALRVAQKANLRARRSRQPIQGEMMTLNGPERESDLQEIRPLLHAEVGRLPEKYRAPIVLCYFEGQTHEEAAEQLCWPVGTVKGRLVRARELLHSRLSRRGIALSVGLLALIESEARAAVPDRLIDETVLAAREVAIDRPLVAAVSLAAWSAWTPLKSLCVLLAVLAVVVLVSTRGKILPEKAAAASMVVGPPVEGHCHGE